MSNSMDLSPNPSHLEVLRSASCRMARDSMVEEPSHGMARTAEAEVSNLGTLPGAPPGADSLLGVAHGAEGSIADGLPARRSPPSPSERHPPLTRLRAANGSEISIVRKIDLGGKWADSGAVRSGDRERAHTVPRVRSPMAYQHAAARRRHLSATRR